MLFENGKIASIEVENFMVFHDLKLDFSERINVISGENATGKTVLLKLLYASLKSIVNTQKEKNPNKENREKNFVEKFQGVFRPDENNIGRLVNRKQGTNTTRISIGFSNQSRDRCDIEFNSRQKNHMDITYSRDVTSLFRFEPIYIPPKEIISSTENFGSLYRDYQIAFERNLC